MKKYIVFYLFLTTFLVSSQQNFYLGFGSVSTVAQLKKNSNYSEKNNIDYGLYYGNNIKISNSFLTTIEVFYLNQRVVLNKTRSSRFELHQNIGFGIKPGFYSGRHSIHLSSGILGVYVFDKNNEGNQFDHFDEAYYYGMDYNYDFTNKLSCNLSVILTDFYSLAHFSNTALEEYAVFQLSLHYNLF